MYAIREITCEDRTVIIVDKFVVKLKQWLSQNLISMLF